MSPKVIAARRRLFLKALGETGNVTLSAERARVARSWVHNQRKGDPEFDAGCRAAVAAAAATFAALAAGGSGVRKPPAGWGYLDGAELVVKAAAGRRVQVTRARPDQWTPGAEARFLQVLGATCNVKAACSAVGMSTTSAYAHRRRWLRFARLWDEALATGYMRVEIALVENGGNLFSAPECPPEAPMPDMKVADAIHLLHMHKNRIHGIGRAPGRWRRPRTMEEMRGSILRKIRAIENAADIGPEERAADEREYARRRPWPGEEAD